MVNLLGDTTNNKLLEPSIGEGDLLTNLLGKPHLIDAFDIDDAPFKKNKHSYNHDINFYHECFIENFIKKQLNHSVPCDYDAVIANPPYGLDLSPNLRDKLKKLFPNLYVKESYSLFLYMSLKQLKENGRYVFLIPDSFLTNHRQHGIRSFLANEASPTHIIRFPSKLFESINFQYANLCIIAGYKKQSKKSDTTILADVDSLDNIDINSTEINTKLLKENIFNGWSNYYLIEQSKFTTPIWTTLGDLAECKTGIYTGDNENYIGFNPSLAKRKKNGHPIHKWNENVKLTSLTEDEKNSGLSSCTFKYVPFIRGGHRKIFEETHYAILWDKDSINFYKTNKRSRFQNNSFYFKEGIALPMVSSNRISASYINNAVFDQGVVGIFPKNKNLLAPILLYLNSDLASYLMKSIVNGSANNSANYIKKLPIPIFTKEDIDTAHKLLNKYKNNRNKNNEDINSFIKKYT